MKVSPAVTVIDSCTSVVLQREILLRLLLPRLWRLLSSPVSIPAVIVKIDWTAHVPLAPVSTLSSLPHHGPWRCSVDAANETCSRVSVPDWNATTSFARKKVRWRWRRNDAWWQRGWKRQRGRHVTWPLARERRARRTTTHGFYTTLLTPQGRLEINAQK